MATHEFVPVIQSALGSMANGPLNLAKSLRWAGDLNNVEIDESILWQMLELIIDADPNASARLRFEQQIHEWDNACAESWTGGTAANSLERRARIYACLAVDEGFAKRISDTIPLFSIEEPTVIAGEHEEWYTPERKGRRAFYWPAYQHYLRRSGWPEESITTLDSATDRITARLSDPERAAAFQSKGLVVGYVQSGKTANFTGIIAKAADAGYRLIIVLAGTLNILRDQTQRRIDKELIGREMLGGDYDGDREIEEFVSHGARPSDRGYFDWHRLTGPSYDYQSLKRGLESLEFEKRDDSKPLYHPENLHRCKARLLIVKKNGTIIRRLLNDFRKLKTKLESVPALIIDDESDQASINTSRTASRRTIVNQRITELLGQFPRGQYVGFTATPFANAFIDPGDPVDIFPKDFMIVLPRPKGYMGLTEFVDQDDGLEECDSNEYCHVRTVSGGDEEPENLQKAIDSFVLSGAIKLYREQHDRSCRFRHHTMLVHTSHLRADQADLAKVLGAMHEGAGYDSPAGHQRLRHLWVSDFLPVCKCRSNRLPCPQDFVELESYVGECISRIDAGKSVLVVNGDNDDTPDFAQGSVWKILVGGNKLSRGYTVEGLTVSYYRRVATAADTLMQMGRWFGFRPGYSDLVRLFIGRNEGTPAKPRDLYADFRELFQMEEEFRGDLRKYSEQRSPRVLPRQVPPLVAAYVSIPPTSRNKMFNAKVVGQNFGGELSEKTIAPDDREAMLHNQALMEKLLKGCALQSTRLSCEISSDNGATWPRFRPQVHIARFDNERLVEFLTGYKWRRSEAPLEREIGFLNGKRCDHGITGWRMLAFQLEGESYGAPHVVHDTSFKVKSRTRTASGRFGVYSEPNHIAVSQFLTALTPQRLIRNLENELLEKEPHVGTFLCYPVREAKNDLVTIGFALLFPENDIPRRLWFTAHDTSNEDAVVVST